MKYYQALEILAEKISSQSADSYQVFDQLLQQTQPQVMRYKPQRSRQSSVGLRHFSSQYY
jgi:hypothetical protein